MLQQPAHVRAVAALRQLTSQDETRTVAAMGAEHVDVGQVGQRDSVEDRPIEPDLASVAAEAGDPPRGADLGSTASRVRQQCQWASVLR